MNAKNCRRCWFMLSAFGWFGLGLSLSAESELPKWALGPFVRPETGNPVIKPDASVRFDCPMRQQTLRWQALYTFNPAAVFRDGTFYVLYRAEDDTGALHMNLHTSRIGLADSPDGVHFKTHPRPVLYPDIDNQTAAEWTGGCEDPRVVEGEDGLYVMTYTQSTRNDVRLAIATSHDLLNWQKQGPAFGRTREGKYASLPSKSGAIVCTVEGERLKAVKIQGKYWMYWGAGVISLAHSENLLDWTIVENSRGEKVTVLRGRNGYFDSGRVECGPPAVLTEKGILLLYNGENLGQEGRLKGDPELANGAYAAGQALFDGVDPAKLIGRTDSPFIKPEQAYEKTGQYAGGATFIEGLVYAQGKWFLYYSCADSTIGVAIFDPTGP